MSRYACSTSGGRGIVASVEPHQQAGMAAQAINLVPQRLLCDFKIGRLPLRPSLPGIATAPAGHDQDALPICQVEKLLSFQLALEPDGVEAHVAHVAEFILQALRVFAEHQVRSPAAAANQNVLAVDVEDASANRIEVGSDFANAKLALGAVAQPAAGLEFHRERMQVRLAHLRRPPQARVRQDELWKLIRRENDV